MMKNIKLTIPAVLFLLSAILLFVIIGCGGESNPDEEDTPTSGKIKISVDETFAPVIDSQVFTFGKLYPYAKINASYKPEAEAINDLLTDSARLIMVTRKLTKEENSYFEKQNIVPIVRKVCYDAIAVIMNNQNRDTLLTMQNFRDIMSGKITTWKQLNPGSNLSNIQIVFDNPNSSTVRFVKEKINNSPLSKNTYAVNNNQAVVDYVSKNKNSLGVIGVNWISNKHDTLTRGFLTKIKVAALAKDSLQKAPSVDDYYQPYQAYIAQKTYPLVRELYILSGEARAGLGSGFTAFVASDRGQRIFLKAGLVPATAPIRLVEINKENIRITK